MSILSNPALLEHSIIEANGKEKKKGNAKTASPPNTGMYAVKMTGEKKKDDIPEKVAEQEFFVIK